MNKLTLLLLLLTSCAGLGGVAANLAENFVEKEARDSVEPDLFAVRESLKTMSSRMDLLTESLSTVAAKFSIINNNIKDMNNELNKYSISKERKMLTMGRRIGLIEEKLEKQNAQSLPRLQHTPAKKH